MARAGARRAKNPDSDTEVHLVRSSVRAARSRSSAGAPCLRGLRPSDLHQHPARV